MTGKYLFEFKRTKRKGVMKLEWSKSCFKLVYKL